MNAAHAIERAEHALRTGQPNLAMTYMRRAAVLVAQDRAESRRAILRARMARANPFELVELAIEEAVAALEDTVGAFIKAFKIPSPKTNYTLAGPSKGGN